MSNTFVEKRLETVNNIISTEYLDVLGFPESDSAPVTVCASKFIQPWTVVMAKPRLIEA